MPAPELPILAFSTPDAWADWLAIHHATSPGGWIQLAKGGNPALITYAQALEGALIWGWIDGQKRGHDEVPWLQRFTRRGPRSVWSEINRDKATALIEAGRMAAPGLVDVDRARADGRWDAAYASQRTAEVPDDLRAALDANPEAAAFFATLDAANRYAVLFRVQTAKKAATRADRIARFVDMLARGEKLHR